MSFYSSKVTKWYSQVTSIFGPKTDKWFNKTKPVALTSSFFSGPINQEGCCPEIKDTDCPCPTP